MGPMGHGAMTGGGRGWCGGANTRDELPPRGPGLGLGLGNGRGGGGGRHRHCYHATGLTGGQRAQLGWPGLESRRATVTEQLAVLKWQGASLEQALGELKSRLQELDKLASETSEKEHE